MTSSLTPVRSAVADILFYRNDLRDWRKPDGTEVGSTSEAGRAIVHVVQGNQGYQIFAVRVRDDQMLLNQQLYENFHYKVATPVFHQWKNEQKQVIGLSFQDPNEAISFSRTVKEIVEALGGQQPLQQQQYQQINGNVSNGVYQDPQTLYQQQNHRQQQQQYANNNKDMDQESIGSGHSAAGMTNYRQQQKSSYSSLQNGHSNTLSQQQQQRRCSQGSSGSGSTPSSSNIYQATTPLTSTNYGQSNGHHQNGSNGVPVVKAPVPPPPPPPPQQLNGSSSNTNNGTSSSVAQVSKNAPPPPPPPPPGGLSLSDQLKNATLRKSSAPVNRAASDVSQQQQQPQPKTSVAGAQNLMSELAAKLGSRNTGVSTASSSIGISSTENGSTDSSGATMVGTTTTKKSSAEVPSTPSAPKPWSKPNGVAGITAANTGTLDSPKGQRKVMNASNSVEGSSSITVADLEQFKQEILNEVNKTKEDISEIRQDISKLVKTQQEIFETLRAVLNQR